MDKKDIQTTKIDPKFDKKQISELRITELGYTSKKIQKTAENVEKASKVLLLKILFFQFLKNAFLLIGTNFFTFCNTSMYRKKLVSEIPVFPYFGENKT